MATLRKNAVTFKGNPLDLEGPELKVGEKAPADFALVQNDMSPLAGPAMAKKPRIVVTVPSLDTPVCDLETRRFNTEATKVPGVTVYTVSMDLPFAQARWCGAAGINNVKTASDHKDRSFGRAYGAWLPALGLLARAVFVIDRDDVVRHVEYVSEVTHEPNYDKAIEAAKKL
ncbi:MAG: thiol peroxidase [Deltaproteobacteria bacterium]|nr:thiol peroxidase [Deltaproteobacteria bacterium]